jgi:hypothetical protein
MSRASREREVLTILLNTFQPSVFGGTGHFQQAAARIVALWPDEEEKPEVVTGFEIINGMTKEQMISECMQYQLKLWQSLPEGALRKMVVAVRVNDYQERMKAEAGISDGPEGFASIFGS